ncbi:MAG: alpha/beta fold hydrolase, partial [Hyphococcus sp.]
MVIAASTPTVSARSASVIETVTSLREQGADDDLWRRTFFHWLFAPAFFDHERAVEAALAMARAYPHAQSVEDMRLQANAVRNVAIAPLLGRIGAPLCLLSGEHDHLTSSAEMRTAFKPVAKAVFHTLAGAGHALHWDQPSAFAAAVLAFIENGVVPRGKD